MKKGGYTQQPHVHTLGASGSPREKEVGEEQLGEKAIRSKDPRATRPMGKSENGKRTFLKLALSPSYYVKRNLVGLESVWGICVSTYRTNNLL